MFKSVRTRIVVVFLCVSVVVMAAITAGSYQLIYVGEHAVTDFVGQASAQICSASFSYLLYSDFEIDPDSEDYRDVRENLRDICRDTGMSYMYAYYCDVDAGTATYLMCVAADDADDELVKRERSYGTVVHRDFSEQELRTLDGEYISEARVVDNRFGAMLSWYDKVDGADNLLAGADYAIGEQRARVMRVSAAVIALIALALLVLLLVQMAVLRTSVFRPLRTIAGRMKAFTAERASALEPLGIKTHDEMGEIAEAFEGMASDIDTYLTDIERMTTERMQGEVELDVARRIQLGMVPERSSVEGAGFEVCAFARPAREVGGDFYDCLALDDGRVAVVVGDVSGKGVAAALFMAMAKTMIRESLAIGMGPADTLNRANANLCQANPEGMFVTAFAAVLDPATGHVRFSNAGHMPPLVAGGRVRAFDAEPGTLLGLFDDVELAEGELTLGEGESLLLFTDGVTEAVSVDGSFFGEERLAGCLGERAPYADAQALVDETVALVEDFAAGREQFDDLTIVALMRCGGGGEVLPVDIASFVAVREAILGSGIDGTLARKACLACEEAFANIVSYSGARAIWFSVRVDGGSLSVTLADDGAPFDPTASVPAEKPFEDLDGGGMGIGLIRQMTSAMEYRRDGGCNVLELRFDLKG